MYRDLSGKTRVKLGLHHHTTVSDGKKTPEELAAVYRAAGYDAVALTDHWVYQNGGELAGLPILSGAEYHIQDQYRADEVWHIVCLFAEREPDLQPGAAPQAIVDAIHQAGGLAVLGHPAWSLNKPEAVERIVGFDATEIWNTTSGVGACRRPDSSLIVDMLARDGYYLPLLATDDSHNLGERGVCDGPVAFIMAESDDVEPAHLKEAVKRGAFYASTGPEIHLLRESDGRFHVLCSPATEIIFFSNLSYGLHSVSTGDGITEAWYEPHPGERYVRAAIRDKDGREAWTNPIIL